MVFWRDRGWKDEEEAVEARDGVCSMTDMASAAAAARCGDELGAEPKEPREDWSRVADCFIRLIRVSNDCERRWSRGNYEAVGRASEFVADKDETAAGGRGGGWVVLNSKQVVGQPQGWAAATTTRR